MLPARGLSEGLELREEMNFFVADRDSAVCVRCGLSPPLGNRPPNTVRLKSSSRSANDLGSSGLGRVAWANPAFAARSTPNAKTKPASFDFCMCRMAIPCA